MQSSSRGRRPVHPTIIALAGILTFAATAVPGVTAATVISRSVLGSGGSATAPGISLRSTVGQLTVHGAGSPQVVIASGFWIPGAGTPTAVDGDELPGIPAVYQLHQNAPNPFNPRTLIRFDLPEATTVRLRVYDLAGRLVKTLVNGPETAGARSVVWTGDDDRGRSVSSGIYVYVLETESYQDRKKLTLVR